MFDPGKAKRAIDFFQSLKLWEGEKAGENFILTDDQKMIVSDIFGTVDESGKRIYRKAYISAARKWGKTPFVAAFGLYMLVADGEQGGQVYCAASEKEQAGILYRHAMNMKCQSPALNKRLKHYDSVKRITYPAMASFLSAISAEAYSKHGYNSNCILYDELHAAPNADLYDVLDTSQATRREPLFIIITTAGNNINTICHEVYTYAKNVRDGIIDDPSFYVYIREAEKEDDWEDPEVWRKANPHIDITIPMSYYEAKYKEAKLTPRKQNVFRQLLLNQWVEQAERWISISDWDNCIDVFDDNELVGRPCYGGLDLSSSIDLSSFTLVFPADDGRFIIKPMFFIPEMNLKDRSDRDMVPYDAWVRDEYIRATPGNVIDYAWIKAYISECAELYDLREIAYDRWNATQIVTELIDDGYEMVQFGQGYASMSPASKEFERLLLDKKLSHDNNPVLKWNASNVALSRDPSGNIKPDKQKSNARIDGIVASIMALDRAIRNIDSSAYDDRGLLTI